MFDGIRKKLALVALGRAALDAWNAFTGKGAKTMTDAQKYNVGIGVFKAVKAAGALYAGGALTASGLGGVVLPSSVDEFKAAWPQITVAIVGGLIKFGLNWWKQNKSVKAEG